MARDLADTANSSVSSSSFSGWPKDMYDFYDGLEENNTRDYFHANRPLYEGSIKAPMAQFLAANEVEFGAGHIFRPNRDVRFAADKRPYKDHCGAVVHHDSGPIYYVQVNGDGLMAGAGYYMMQSDQISRYRAAVADEKSGAVLAGIVDGLRHQGYEVGRVDLKRVPTPYPKDHVRADLLRHKSVTMTRSWKQPRWLSTARAGTEVVTTWRAALPLNAWLVQHVGPTEIAENTGR